MLVDSGYYTEDELKSDPVGAGPGHQLRAPLPGPGPASHGPRKAGCNGRQPILEMRGITKAFPGVKALSDVNLDVRRGEIHAICGENGAGKSP